jgi:hypothetical protein
MTERRWTADGKTFWVGEVPYRVVSGDKGKGPDDQVLEWCIDGAWHRPGFVHAFLHADFLYDNEDHIYRPPAEGGPYFARRLGVAMEQGWRRAAAMLGDEKRAKRARGCGEERRR